MVLFKFSHFLLALQLAGLAVSVSPPCSSDPSLAGLPSCSTDTSHSEAIENGTSTFTRSSAPVLRRDSSGSASIESQASQTTGADGTTPPSSSQSESSSSDATATDSTDTFDECEIDDDPTATESSRAGLPRVTGDVGIRDTYQSADIGSDWTSIVASLKSFWSSLEMGNSTPSQTSSTMATKALVNRKVPAATTTTSTSNGS